MSLWYQVDHNAVDEVFQLVPITVHYPNYSSKDEALRGEAREGWWNTFLSLQRTFWTLVKMAVAEGRITKERAHIYLQSSERAVPYFYLVRTSTYSLIPRQPANEAVRCLQNSEGNCYSSGCGQQSKEPVYVAL
jgi:hypothetical protein